MYIYPDNLKSKAVLWLWQLRDIGILRKIHKYIFGDIYEWAGEIRWVNIAKGNMFCNYEFIETNADSLFKNSEVLAADKGGRL